MQLSWLKLTFWPTHALSSGWQQIHIWYRRWEAAGTFTLVQVCSIRVTLTVGRLSLESLCHVMNRSDFYALLCSLVVKVEKSAVNNSRDSDSCQILGRQI